MENNIKMGNKPNTLKNAFMASPGPDNFKQAGVLAAKGLCMGTADIIPGVSGGTIALITGIYSDLINAVRSIDAKAIGCMLKFDLKGLAERVHFRFLITLFLGIAVAIVSLAQVMHFLLTTYAEETGSFFFGLILASIFVVIAKAGQKNLSGLLCFLGGGVFAWFIVGLIPVATPDAMWFIFVSGFVGICAMILPGLSGAFILLILGKYAYITGAVKNPLAPGSAIVILVFCTGCAAGLACFSRFLNWLLTNYYQPTLFFLAGLMFGSMRKIWPYKEIVASKMVRGKLHVISTQNIIPDQFTTQIAIALGLAVIGFIIVMALDRFSKTQS